MSLTYVTLKFGTLLLAELPKVHSFKHGRYVQRTGLACKPWYDGIFAKDRPYFRLSTSAYTGMLDWDSTGVLFTKRSLIEFLKLVLSYGKFNHLNIGSYRYTGVTVDPNFTNIGKLPRMI